MQIFKECPLCQAKNHDRKTRIYFSADWEGFYQLERHKNQYIYEITEI